jgi:hypothetical protein
VRAPYERFLRYLVSRKADVDLALERIGLPPVGELFVHQTMPKLRAGAPRTALRYLDSHDDRVVFKKDLIAWAEKHEIRPLWEDRPEFRTGAPDAALAAAQSLFFSPRTRSVLGMLLLCRAAVDDLRKVMRDRFGVQVSERVLSVYESIFWDWRQTTPAFWQDILPRFSADERQCYAIALRWPPPRVSELRHFLGLDTQREPEAVLRQLMENAEQSYLEAMSTPTPDHRSALPWAALAGKMAERLWREAKVAAKPVEDPAGRFNLVSVRVERTPIPTLAELEGEVSYKPEPR